MAAVSKHWHSMATSQELWRRLCDRDHQLCTDNSAPGTPRTDTDWLFAYKRRAAVKSLKEVTWTQPGGVSGSPPPRVEGHGACPWGVHGMLLWGGFGAVGAEQVFCLEQTDSGLRWRLLRITGGSPRLRYGHTLTRIGRAGDMALLIGGMTRGGYGGETFDMCVLRRVPGEAEEVFEWHVPDTHGETPHARGYHTATAAPDGSKVAD